MYLGVYRDVPIPSVRMYILKSFKKTFVSNSFGIYWRWFDKDRDKKARTQSYLSCTQFI